MTPDALLFDLDGLLINTEVFSQRAFTDTTESHNLGDLSDFFLSLVGTNEQHHTIRLKEELGQLVDPVNFRKEWVDRFHAFLETEEIGLLPGVIEVLEFATQANIKCAVATSSTTKAAEKKIGDCGIRDYFQTITCGDQVEISKPHPEIYLKAGASVNADMAKSIGLEDSANGVKAATAAGLNVIQIPNLVPPSKELLELNHRVCDSMHDVLALLMDENAVL